LGDPRGEQRVFMQEVSFMVIGEVTVRPAPPPTRPGCGTVAYRRARKAGARRKGITKKR
jgi:hypothetical protein